MVLECKDIRVIARSRLTHTPKFALTVVYHKR